MSNQSAPSLRSNLASNQLKAYQKNSSLVTVDQAQYPLPDYDSLVQITRLCSKIAIEKSKLQQKQLQLHTAKLEYKQKLLSEEKDIRSRVITLKKRQNIAEVVEKIRQSELELQTKILARIEQYKPAKKLDKNQKHNLFMALINKVTDVN
jgi:uncharacterized ubiquitin-like protein YukD